MIRLRWVLLKDKILFWINPSLTHFGIAKFLQEKYEADLYVIYDFNHHLKKSFTNQKVVNFQKEWYYWDHFQKTKEKPDLKYLASFEEKYKINLWMIAYTERLFYKYNNYYKFNSDEILSILEQDCKFFDKVLDEIKPDFLITHGPDFHRSHLLAEMCKSRGIKVLMLFLSRFGYRSVISSEFDKIDDPCNIEEKSEDTERTIIELKNYLIKFDKSKQVGKIQSGGIGFSVFKKLKVLLHWMTKTFDKEYKSTYDHYGVTRSRVIINQVFSSLKRHYREFFINRSFTHEITEDEKFVYFPLQVEPERNISIGAPFYSNQLETIINIAKSLPVEYKLYVKEHYSMKLRGWRNLSYYKKILDLPNVKLIHPSVKPEEIMSKCSLVLATNGTSGLEAAFYGKPSIVFADTSYSNFSWVHRIRGIEELPQAIRTSLKKKVNLSDLNRFINLLEKNSLEVDEVQIWNDIFNRFHQGFLIGDNISTPELNSYFEENRSIFERLALEHIKKINQHKK